MNITQAKMVVLLNSVGTEHRNAYYLADKLKLSFASTYTYVRMLEAGKKIVKVKQGKKSLLQVADQEALDEAREVIAKEGETNVLSQNPYN